MASFFSNTTMLSEAKPFFFPLISSLFALHRSSQILGYVKDILPIRLPLHYRLCIGQSYRLCLQIVWQHSQRHKVVGVLGSPEMNFVAHGQARIKTAVANV